MKQKWMWIPILLALLTTLVAPPAQADPKCGGDDPPAQAATNLTLPKNMPTMTEAPGTGMEITQKITGDLLQLDIKVTDDEVAYFGFGIKFDPKSYELEKVLAGNVLQNNADGHLVIGSLFGLKDTPLNTVITLRKKGTNWGEIKPDGLYVSTKSKDVQVFEEMAPFVPKPSVIPKAQVLMNNYPNPFNPSTEIRYTLPTDGPVELTVYNMVGQVVRTLVKEQMTAGEHIFAWNATGDNGQPVAGGVYFYRITSGAQTVTRRMLLLK